MPVGHLPSLLGQCISVTTTWPKTHRPRGIRSIRDWAKQAALLTQAATFLFFFTIKACWKYYVTSQSSLLKLTMKPSLLKSLDIIPAWEIGLPALVAMRSDSNTTFRKMERLSITLWKRKELSIYHLDHTNIWNKVREFLHRLLNSNSISLQSLYWRSTTLLILKLRGGGRGAWWSGQRPDPNGLPTASGIF